MARLETKHPASANAMPHFEKLFNQNSMKINALKTLLLATLFTCPPLSKADTIQLNPGTLTGSVTMGSETIIGGQINANSSDGFSSSASFQGNSYVLTVGGDKTWVSSVSFQTDTGLGSRANTAIYRNNQVTVPAGQSVPWNYNYPAARIHGTISVSGGSVESYSVAASGGQNGESFSSSASFQSAIAGGAFSIPMVPGPFTQVYGSITVVRGDGQRQSLGLQSQNIQLGTDGAELNWSIDLDANTGSLEGRLAFAPSDIVMGYQIYISGPSVSSSAEVWSNSGDYSFAALPPGRYQVNLSTYFLEPYGVIGTYRDVTVAAGQATVLDFDTPLSFAKQSFTITGSRTTADASSAFAYAYGYGSPGFAYDYFDPVTASWDFALTSGQWYFPYFQVQFGNNNGVSSVTIQDWNPSNTLTTISPDQTPELPARILETSSGEILLDVFEAPGQPEILISNPQLNGSQFDYVTGKSIYLSAYAWGVPSAHPSLQVNGAPGTYDAIVQALVNGSWVVFGRFQLKLGAPESTPVGGDVLVEPSPEVDIVFSNVTSPGVTTVSQSAVGPQEPAGFQIFAPGGTRLYYDITTTATFNGPVEVCFEYVDTDDGSASDIPAKQEKNLKLLHYDSTTATWVNITTGHDLVNNRLCGSTPSFSVFAIALSNDPEFTSLSLPAEPIMEGSLVLLMAGFTDADMNDAHQAVISWGDGSPNSTATIDDANGVLYADHVYALPGNYTPEVILTDNTDNSVSISGIVTVLANNQAPIANAGPDQTLFAGPNCSVMVTLDGSLSSDPDSDALGFSWARAGFALGYDYRQTVSLAPGVHVITLAVTDAKGATSTDDVVITVINRTPTISAGGEYSVLEGGSISITAVASDPDGGALHIAWDLHGNGEFSTHGNSVVISAVNLDGPNTYSIPVRVTDACGMTATDVATLHVINAPPIITAISGPSGPLPIGSSTATVSANFSDPGTQDTYTARFDWGDGTLSEATPLSGVATAAHTYDRSGVFSVKVTITDDDAASVVSSEQLVAVYDPTGGFVTGAGWINSPPGAYAANSALFGKATFGFVSKYQKGANVPTGNTQFQFQAAGMEFKSSVYQWLVVSGARAQYKGDGTINGAGNYGFLLTATDGQISGGGGVDKFRIKIWDKTTGQTAYDNSVGASDDIDTANPQAIGSGSIVIHNK